MEGRQVGRMMLVVNERLGVDMLKGANRMTGKEPDYLNGISSGNMTAQFIRRISDFASHPLMESAIESANIPYTAAHLAKTGEIAPVRQATREEIAAMLVEHLFLEIVEKRFGTAGS